MFQSLKPNNTLYVLHKDAPALQIGTVVRTTLPVPKWPSGQDLVVDVTATIDGKEATYPMLPAGKERAVVDGTNIVVADNKEEICKEIKELKKKSEELLENIEYHKSMIATCDALMAELNPELAERRQQQDDINTLKTAMQEMKESIALLISELKPKS